MAFLQDLQQYNTPKVSSERKRELQLFEKHAAIRFRRLELLNLAFCHRSYANEQPKDIDNNEKLEFLGDSVLGLVVSEYLYRNYYETMVEGDFARIKSFVVSEDSLAEIAKRIKVDNYILIGKGEEYSGGRGKKAILADCMEAIIGSYYLDSGFKSAQEFVLSIMIPEISKVLQNKHKKDYKTLLQELVQKRYKTYPRYTVVKRSGPDHDRVFWVSVSVNDEPYGPGKGKNKKEAEQHAAGIAYQEITQTK